MTYDSLPRLALTVLAASLFLPSCRNAYEAPRSTAQSEIDKVAADTRPDHCSFESDESSQRSWPIVGEPRSDLYRQDPTPLRRISNMEETLREAALGCQRGDPSSCLEVAHYYREASRNEELARRLYARAADLTRAQLSTAPVGADAGPVGQIDMEDPQAICAAFRQTWFAEVVPAIEDKDIANIANVLAPCMSTDFDYMIRRVSRREAFRLVYVLTHELDGTFQSSLIHGDIASLAGPRWVWSVEFRGGTRLLAPWGAFGGFLDPENGRLLVAYHWPEG